MLHFLKGVLYATVKAFFLNHRDCRVTEKAASTETTAPLMMPHQPAKRREAISRPINPETPTVKASAYCRNFIFFKLLF
jgi:hypothetical protein